MNVPLFLAYLISVIIMVFLPIGLAVWVTRKFKVSWWVILVGVVTFLVSQLARIPAANGLNTLFNNGTIPVPSQQWLPLFNGLVGGLLAGIFEETARWGGFMLLNSRFNGLRNWLRRVFKKSDTVDAKPLAKKYGSALALGVGHGGTESILLFAMYMASTLFTVIFYNAGAQIAKGVSTDQVQYMLAQIQQFWSNPWTMGFLPGVERVIALSTQIFLSTLVWKAIADRSFLWFALAVIYHMIIDAVSVFLSGIGWSYWAVEGVLAIFMAFNIYMIIRFINEEREIEAEMAEEGEVDDEDEDEKDEDDEVDDEEEVDVDEDAEDQPLEDESDDAGGEDSADSEFKWPDVDSSDSK